MVGTHDPASTRARQPMLLLSAALPLCYWDRRRTAGFGQLDVRWSRR